jgi:hypothetical protein
VREIRSPGSVRGVPGNRHSYRDTFGHSGQPPGSTIGGAPLDLVIFL